MTSAYADRIDDLAAGASAARERVVGRSDGSPFSDPERGEGSGDDEGNDGGEGNGGVEGNGGLRIAGTEVSDREEAALVAARDGLGPVVAVYVEARTADEWVWFSEVEMERLHAATRDWLAVYAGCHGVDADPDVTVREAAEVLLDTHDITDVAALLTGLHRT